MKIAWSLILAAAFLSPACLPQCEAASEGATLANALADQFEQLEVLRNSNDKEEKEKSGALLELAHENARAVIEADLVKKPVRASLYELYPLLLGGAGGFGAGYWLGAAFVGP